MNEIFIYYSTLYSSHSCFADLFVSTLPEFHSSNDSDQTICEGELTLEECSAALLSMKNEKSPGSDGLSTNFYKKYWHLIGPHVVASLNFAFRSGSLSTEQSRGVISLILKPGKESDKLENYRPITLLNTDYKIGAKALATRLKSCNTSLIGPIQSGFLKGRFIGENIRYVLDCIEFTADNNIPGFLLFVDFQKAFDKIE